MELRQWPARIIVGLLVFGFILGVSLGVVRQRRRADIAGGQVTAAMAVESTSFPAGAMMPPRLSCDGANLSPEVHWPDAPSGTRSFAIILEDRDTPFGFVHWLVYNLPPSSRALAEASPSHSPIPQGAAEGMNSAETVGYTGPCPPGSGGHRYVIRLYALDLAPNLPPGQTKQQLAAAVKGHVLAEGRVTGLYARGKH